MASGPTPQQIARGKTRMWKELREALDRVGLALARERGADDGRILNEGRNPVRTVRLDLLRASNGEAALVWRLSWGAHDKGKTYYGARDLIVNGLGMSDPTPDKR